MNKSKSSGFISDILITWYNNHKRDLPWREINNPYLIWISEIILQQTRVNQGIAYYLRFVERFPTVDMLAEAEEDEVLKYWQGLGYYSRARNLHKAACQMINESGGVFPTKHSEVLKLAGVGEYTAAAICSFAYNEPYAVVDGNVYRVLSRLFSIDTPIDSGVGKKEFTHLAQDLLSKSEPALHNQALMEFGALQCVPASPDCANCPLQSICKAFESDLIGILPVKKQKTKVTNRFFNYLFVEYQGYTYLQKRLAKDIWLNLYEFPLIETENLLNPEELPDNDDFKRLFDGIDVVEFHKISNPMKHVLSHRVIYAQFFSLRVSDLSEMLKKTIQVPIGEIDIYPVSRLMELFLQNRKE
ncbi:MAG: A/G-specific adenine glycosylase [Paludibacter sp.]